MNIFISHIMELSGSWYKSGFSERQNALFNLCTNTLQREVFWAKSGDRKSLLLKRFALKGLQTWNLGALYVLKLNLVFQKTLGISLLMSRAIPSLSCVHMTRDKGICHVHGSGARKSWKPSTKKIVGLEWKTTTRYTRRYFCVCDVGPKRGKMIQQKLSFSNRPS